jgi:hypothetical protein
MKCFKRITLDNGLDVEKCGESAYSFCKIIVVLMMVSPEKSRRGRKALDTFRRR